MNTPLNNKVDGHYREIVNKVAQQGGDASRLLKLAGLVSTVILPTIIAVFCGFKDDIFTSNAGFGWTIAGMVLIQLILGFFTAFNLVNVSTFHVAAAGLKDAYEDLKKTYTDEAEDGQILASTVIYTENYLSALPIYIDAVKNDPTEFQEAVSEIMDFFVENREDIFGIQRGDLWNFALFVYSEDSKLLIPVWRKCAPSLWDEDNPTPIRAFGTCDGHVGAAFRQDETIITLDAHDSAIQSFTRPPLHLEKDDDIDKYRSFGSFPLESANEHPLGVLVASNNQKSTFTPKNCLAIRSAAHIIALLAATLQSNHIDDMALPWVNELVQDDDQGGEEDEESEVNG